MVFRLWSAPGTLLLMNGTVRKISGEGSETKRSVVRQCVAVFYKKEIGQ